MEPTKTDLEHLERTLLSDAFSDEGRPRTIIQYLFTVVGSKNRNKILVADIVKNCPGRPDAEQPEVAARRAMADIKQRLRDYFRTPEGRELPFRFVYKAVGNYYPKFEENIVKGFYDEFWDRYLSNDAILMYPEPFFVIDPQGTYLRNSAVNRQEEIGEFFSYLNAPHQVGTPYNESLKMGYSYIPAGIVQGMFSIVNSLARHAKSARLETRPVIPGERFPPTEHELIFLATPTSVQEMVAVLEGPHPFQSNGAGITRNEKLEFEDREDDKLLIKWGLVTRKQQRDRMVTVISASHGKTVEGIVGFLTKETRLAELAEKLGDVDSFDTGFQAIFRVEMGKTPGGPHIEDTHLEHVKRLPITH